MTFPASGTCPRRRPLKRSLVYRPLRGTDVVKRPGAREDNLIALAAFIVRYPSTRLLYVLFHQRHCDRMWHWKFSNLLDKYQNRVCRGTYLIDMVCVLNCFKKGNILATSILSGSQFTTYIQYTDLLLAYQSNTLCSVVIYYSASGQQH
jgi:hypothetical protein